MMITKPIIIQKQIPLRVKQQIKPMSSNNNNYSQYYQGDLSKNASGWSSYRNKYEKPQNYPQNNLSNIKAPYQKQEQFQNSQLLTGNPSKKFMPKEYLKQASSKFEISSDSDDYQENPQQTSISYPYKPSSPVLSIQSHQHLAQQNHSNKHQQIYELKMKIMSLENQYLVDKKQLIDKYEKQLFDLNKVKSSLQEDKIRLNKQVDSLNHKIQVLNEQNQQLKDQLQVLVGDNRKTPNFNSKDFGDVDLIIMNTNKDEKIKNLENQLNAISKQKQMIETSLLKNRGDRSSGQSFGNRNQIAISFGQIEENLRMSLRQSNKVNENLIRQVELIKKELENQQERVTKLTIQNMALEADKQIKYKQIQSLNEKLIKAQGKAYLLEKQHQNYSNQIKITENMLQIKEKELRKLKQTLENQQEKARRMIKQFQKSEKDWANKTNKLQADKILTINQKIDPMKKQQAKLIIQIDSLMAQNRILSYQNKACSTQNKSLAAEKKSLLSENKTLQSENKYFQGENKSLSSEVKKLQQSAESFYMKQEKLKAQVAKKQLQNQETSRMSQQIMRQMIKLKNTCKIQQQRIIELQKNLVSVKQEKKNLKQEAQKIMRKQKGQISTLKESLELMTQKQQQIKSQFQHQSEVITEMNYEKDRLNQRIQELTNQINELNQINESLKNQTNNYEENILQIKKQNYQLLKQTQILKRQPQRLNYQLQKLQQRTVILNQQVLTLTSQVDRLNSFVEMLNQQLQKKDQQICLIYQNQPHSTQINQQKPRKTQTQNTPSPQLEKAYIQLKNQFDELQTKFDKETTEKQEMLQALNQKIVFFQNRYNDDFNRLQQVSDQKNQYMKQAQNLTYKCQQMYEYIQKMHSQGQAPIENTQNRQHTQELQRENEHLKKQVYRLSSELQVLQNRFKVELIKKQSLKQLHSPQQKINHTLLKNNDQSSSLQSSVQDSNPLQSALQIMKIQKQQMIQTINYQNQMIHSLEINIQEAVRNIQNHKENNHSEEYVKHQEMVRAVHQKNREILQEKITQVNLVIMDKEKVIREITQRNQEIMNQFRDFQQEQNEYINKLVLEMNIMKEEKKELHQQLDQANTQLMLMEKQKSKLRSQLMSQLKQQLQHKLIFLNEDMEKLKNQIKRLKNLQSQKQKDHQLQIQYRQELYSKQRKKLMQKLQALGKQSASDQQKIQKANQMIGEEKTLQSEISKRNEQIQVSYFQIKHHNNQLLCQIHQLQQKNHNLNIYCSSIQTQNHQILDQMQQQIQSLIKQNDQAQQLIHSLKRNIEHLENDKIELLLQIQQNQQQNIYQKTSSITSSKLYQTNNNQLPSRDLGVSSIKTTPITDRKQQSYPINDDFIMMQKHKNPNKHQQNPLGTSLPVQTKFFQPKQQKKIQILDLYGIQPSTNTTFPYQNIQQLYPSQDITFNQPKNLYQPNFYMIKNKKPQYEPYKYRNQGIRNQKVSYNRI